MHVEDGLPRCGQSRVMANFFVLTDNASFQTKTEVTDLVDTAESALAIGVRGALTIAGDDVANGERSSAVIVSVQDGVGAELLRSVVTVSVAPLIARAENDD